MNNEDVIVVIPALNPDTSLIDYVKELQARGRQNNILIIDDGSDADRENIFNSLADDLGCVVIRHAVNMGKGRALKDAFNYCLINYKDRSSGVITVDSDGQHTVQDVLRVKQALLENRNALILGVRDFSQSNVPPKSEFGNKITRGIIKLLYGGNISDTQTGLRGMSYDVLPQFLTLFGERFEYETGMLIEALRSKIPIIEVNIQTIYFEENKGTHFNPIIDSWKIYKLILGTFIKYALSSFTSSIIDLGAFQLFSVLLRQSSLSIQVWGATVLARIISSLYNYFVNKNVVFNDYEDNRHSFAKYYLLVVAQMCVSAGLVYLFVDAIRFPKLIVKIIVDTFLFFISFRIQKAWVFGRGIK